MKKTARTAFVLMCLPMVFATGCSQQSIHKAAENGDLAKAERYLQNGADVNTKDKDGRTPLMVAADNGHLEIVNFLISKDADVGAKSKDGKTSLMQAALDGHPDVVE